jgi:hypothetical protein
MNIPAIIMLRVLAIGLSMVAASLSSFWRYLLIGGIVLVIFSIGLLVFQYFLGSIVFGGRIG